MKPLFTIGHTRKSLRHFVMLLRQAGVDAVVDIRLHNTSQLAGFAKRDDLEFLLEEGFGVRYAHHPEFAPSEEVLQSYRKTRDWDAFSAGYRALIEERQLVAHAGEVLAGFARPCLLCAEDDPRRCHRRMLAEAIAASSPDWEVIHLK